MPWLSLFRLLERMPRRADGVTIDFAALEVLSHTLVANSGLAGGGGGAVGPGAGASPEMLELLPTRVFKAKPPAASDAAGSGAVAAGGAGSASGAGGSGSGVSDAEDDSCKICQCEYEDGEELVTLPCLHFFHASCAKEWLSRKRICALCRMPIDIDMDAALAEVLAKEEEEAAAAAKPQKKGAAAGEVPGLPTSASASAPASALSGRQSAAGSSGQSGPASAEASGGFFSRWRRGSR